MSKILKIKFRTVINNGIEYNELPSPSLLIKATKMKWAEKLRNEGCIRLNSVEFYRAFEDSELGDINEGTGMFKLDGRPMQTDSVNEVFIWCCAITEANPETLKKLNCSYDTIVVIHDVEKFVNRIILSAKIQGYTLYPHIGKVKYNREAEISKEKLKSQQWHYNVFQKNFNYTHQEEYRLSFLNLTFKRINQNHIDLLLCNCSDIIEIRL